MSVVEELRRQQIEAVREKEEERKRRKRKRLLPGFFPLFLLVLIMLLQ